MWSVTTFNSAWRDPRGVPSPTRLAGDVERLRDAAQAVVDAQRAVTGTVGVTHPTNEALVARWHSTTHDLAAALPGGAHD